ncbi:MAG: MATE family efflux transporter [Spirochaetales bacterium]|nr:MATE family efflux transporter [Spirochaetales bacterium]
MEKTKSPGSFAELFPLAFPIVLSQAIDVAMIFCDRYFLSRLGREPLAATLTGGLLVFLLSTFMIGTLGQLTPLVSQYRGAGQKDRCVRVVHQGLFLCLVVPPLLLIVAYLGAPLLIAFFAHEESLAQNELRYFRILSFTVLTTSLRQVFANFFIGLGRSRIVTLASVSGFFLNLPLAYGLIFGEFGLPALGIEGAALGTVIASVMPVLILGAAFLTREMRDEYRTSSRPSLNPVLLFQLLRYGFPAGMEMLVNVSGFLFFTMLMYSFSPDVAAATTIVLNWDMVCFVPLLGVSQAVGGLVGKYLGAQRPELALRSAWNSLKIGWGYACLITFSYLMFTDFLIHLFAPVKDASFSGVLPYARIMLQISCFYFLFDATYSVLGGILKGAGDTLWTMAVSNSFMWTCALTIYFSRDATGLTPVGAWIILTVMVFLLGTVYFWRFTRRGWLHRLMIE